jgi:putative ABC transport system permease protein
MKRLSLFQIAVRSIIHNLKGASYQVVIIIILTAVITGSLLTGKSVRSSLKKNSFEKIGSTGIVVSSGARYFDPSLQGRMESKTGVRCTGVLETEGYCQNFTTGQTSPMVKIYGVNDDFFSFHGIDGIRINKGEVAVNERLAAYLGLKEGDELTIRYNTLSDIPADAPFSPAKDATESIVLKTGIILADDRSGNFSLGISQITPLNIFIGLADLTGDRNKTSKLNRLLFRNQHDVTIPDINKSLHEVLKPQDIGLTLRAVPKTGGYELISSRIFIDQVQVDEINKLKLPSFPVITYLANSFTKGGRMTPYSFIAAIDPSLYKGIPSGNGIVINKWMADDLSAATGDSINVAWYSPDPLNHLREKNMNFVVSHVVDMEGIWADSLLMPEFPGIAGKKTCTGWDAGTPINSDRIRPKDEAYWNRFGGTPKAFISYGKGRELWGNNFGPVTSIRFRSDISENEILAKLAGSIDPGKAGFIISDLHAESAKAADEGVDFSTLFLSLGFFIIFSSLILLILVVSIFLESKKEQINTLFSMGFENHAIEKILMYETGMIALCGALLGAFAGGLFNILAIGALNSVWQGAVQTDTLVSDFDSLSLLTGFAITVVIILLILKIKSDRFLKNLNRPETGKTAGPSGRINLIVSAVFVVITLAMTALSFIISSHSTLLSFSAGILLFGTLIFLTRQYFITRRKTGIYSFRNVKQVSGSYYSFYPSQAIAPVLFLAAGLFAVVITGVNRMNLSNGMLKPSGGTGGYLLWGESSVPIRENLSSPEGRNEYGLDEDDLKGLSLIQARKNSGNDASCLNLNHITSPPLLGIDPSQFVSKGAFSFASEIKGKKETNPWLTLNYSSGDSIIYGIADQTVLQYGLKIRPGDTLKTRAESGQVLNVIISAGLKSSVFQGYVLIGSENFSRYFPSIPGSQVFLADGNPELSELYITTLSDRLSGFGVHFEPAANRLATFFVVTNTYLSVFTILGGIGMILGVAGLGFMLIRNFNQRKRQFGLMMAAGFPLSTVRRIIFDDHALILLAGILTGLISALVATRPSIMNYAGIPWKTIAVMIVLILITGFTALAVSVRAIKKDTIISGIRKE